MAKKTKAKSKRKSNKSPIGTASERMKYQMSDAYKKKLAKFQKDHPKFFKPGNDWWNKRSKHGRDAIFSSPQAMQEAIAEYFEFSKSTPLFSKKEYKVINGKLKLTEIPTENPLSWEALCVFLGVSVSYFRTFRSTMKDDNPHKHDFLAVMNWADHVIFSQKLIGSSVGAYNAQLMSYHLGIRKDMPLNSGGSGIVINVTDDKSKSLINDVMNKLNAIDQKEEEKEEKK